MLSKNFKKYIKSLHQRKFRQKYNKIQVDGSKSCLEAIHNIPNAIETIICTEEWQQQHHHNISDIEWEISSPDEINTISQLENNRHVSIIMDLDYDIKSGYKDDWSIYLDDVQDPGNVGTIIRLADWYGIHTVYHSPLSAKIDNPKVIQSTMGGFTRVNSVIQSQEDCLSSAKKPIFIADLDGNSIKSLAPQKEGIIVIGNEGKGISQAFAQANCTKITIPGYGRAESLNASISCGIILSHLL